ncbi:arylesterase [Primorskyibacter sedentarius]|uniref:arylesterase n=1 Tax=Primorskyibacter sedentarius TaxID=745311 RepID=UPI003EBE751F
MAQAAETHILALGDSLTQGYGLIEEEGFVPQLRGWLEEHGHDVRLINGGVSGDTTAGGLARVEWSLTPEVEGMIVTLGGNDLLRGIPPENARENLRGILEVAEARGIEVLLVGLPAPGNYGAAYKQSFDAIYPELSEEFGTLYYPDFFEGMRLAGATSTNNGDFMQDDGIHPNAKGVGHIVDAIGPAVEELIERAEE